MSFSVDREYLYQYGFNVELDRVRALPGAPDHETVDFVVTFDPRGANLGLGEIETFVPLNVRILYINNIIVTKGSKRLVHATCKSDNQFTYLLTFIDCKWTSSVHTAQIQCDHARHADFYRFTRL